MSEKQAKRNRKQEAKSEPAKAKGSVLSNVIITVIILAFLGLGGYALKDSIKSILPERPEKVPTVSDMAKERDMTVEDFLKEYGLEDSEITKDSTESDLMGVFTVANYAKFQDKTPEELLKEYGIEGASEDMLWQDAINKMPMSKYAEMMGTTFDELKAQGGLPEGVTETTTMAELNELMNAQTETPAEETEEQPAEESAE